jgi:hypothetical protein
METIDFKPTAVVIRRGLEPEKKLQIFSLVPSKNRGVPHISLVFREMWDTANLNLFSDFRKTHVECCGIPHLAKNERDMGHPAILGRDKRIRGSLTQPRYCLFGFAPAGGARPSRRRSSRSPSLSVTRFSLRERF